MVRPLIPRSLPLTALLCWTLGGGVAAQHSPDDYDDADPWLGFESPGPTADSAQVSAFFPALEATTPAVCQITVRSIGNNWGHRGDDDRIGMLSDEADDAAVRNALSRPIRDPAALAFLAGAMGHKNPCIRRAAARMLGESRASDSRRLLGAALRNSSARVREAAALGLAHAEDPAYLRELTGALKDADPAVVRMAAFALGELEDARAVKPLGGVLGSRDPGTRATAAWALGEIEDIRAVDRLKRLVGDEDAGVRLATVEALGELEDYRATGALNQAMKDKDVRVRRATAEALGEVEDHRAAETLVKALDDGDAVVRRLAAQSLGELDGLKRAPPRLVSALGDRDPELAVLAAQSLGEIGDTGVVPALAAAYRSDNPRIRYSVVAALAELEDARGEAVFNLASNDRDQIVRHKAAEALRDREDDD